MARAPFFSQVAATRQSPYIRSMSQDISDGAVAAAQSPFDAIRSDFELLDDWEDRYRYVIELGRKLPPLPDEERTKANKVQGCASQVWLATHIDRKSGTPRLVFHGDSDAHIVRGLIAILFALYSGRPADEILKTDPDPMLAQLHLTEHLTPQRSNGLSAMVRRIRADAALALDASPGIH
jgi:cysteine desulfuration protein SufE